MPLLNAQHWLNLWPDIPLALLVAVAFTALLILFALFYYLRTRWIMQHLPQLRREKQAEFLLQLWRQRNYHSLILLSLVGVACTLSLHYMRFNHPIVAPTQPMALPDPARQPISQPILQPMSGPEQLDSVLSLFDGAHSGGEYTLETLKQRYENALTGAYMLHHCKRASDTEIESLMRALRGEIIRFRDEQSDPQQPLDIQSLYTSIVTAAEGSFQLFYRRTPCDAPAIDMLEQQFANFIVRFQSISPEKP